jgi:hypothetical protein
MATKKIAKQPLYFACPLSGLSLGAGEMTLISKTLCKLVEEPIITTGMADEGFAIECEAFIRSPGEPLFVEAGDTVTMPALFPG